MAVQCVPKRNAAGGKSARRPSSERYPLAASLAFESASTSFSSSSRERFV